MLRRVVTPSLVLGAFIGCRDPELAVGRPLPDVLKAATDSGRGGREAVVIWVLDASACLSCDPQDYLARRLAGHSGIRFRVVSVGNKEDEELVRAFLRDRRLPDPSLVLSSRGGAQLFGSRPRPFLVLVEADTVRWMGTDDSIAAIVTETRR